jgi:hypothetical protein
LLASTNRPALLRGSLELMRTRRALERSRLGDSRSRRTNSRGRSKAGSRESGKRRAIRRHRPDASIPVRIRTAIRRRRRPATSTVAS